MVISTWGKSGLFSVGMEDDTVERGGEVVGDVVRVFSVACWTGESVGTKRPLPPSFTELTCISTAPPMVISTWGTSDLLSVRMGDNASERGGGVVREVVRIFSVACWTGKYVDTTEVMDEDGQTVVRFDVLFFSSVDVCRAGGGWVVTLFVVVMSEMTVLFGGEECAACLNTGDPGVGQECLGDGFICEEGLSGPSCDMLVRGT